MDVIKPNYYAILSAEVRYDNKLTPNAKLLYAEITALTNANNICWASDKYFMDLYNVSKSTIQNWMKQLEDNNYIKRYIEYYPNSKRIKNRYITLYQKSGIPYTENMAYPIPKIWVENNTSINNTSINKERNIDSINNIDNEETKKEKISLSISKHDVINLSKENNLDTDVSEKFYYYYKSRNWKVNNNFEINKNNLKANLILWHKREIDYLENQKINNATATKINKPDWIQEYLQEISEMEAENKNMI